MLINNYFLSAETAANEDSLKTALKNFFTELLYGDSGTQYENFSFGNQIVTYRMIIIAIAIGLIIASAAMVYKRKCLGRLVRKLSEAGAVDRENAKMLSEIGLSDSKSIKNSLIRGTLGRMVNCAERDEHEEKMRAIIEGVSATGAQKDGEKPENKSKNPEIFEFVPHPAADRYYLPAEKEKELLALFSEKGSGVGGIILTVVFCIVGAALLFALIPWLIGLLDSAL